MPSNASPLSVTENVGPSESTPLLSHSSHSRRTPPGTKRASSIINDHDAAHAKSATSRRWASFVALGVLCLLAALVILFGFLVPDVMKRYAIEAAIVDVKSVTPEFTDIGARARIQGTFSLQAHKVNNGFVRTIGRFGTWIARKAETGEAQVDVTLPEYRNVLLGSAIVPPIIVSIVNGRQTDLDIVADLIPPRSIDGVRDVIDEWLNKSLDHLHVLGSAQTKLRSGIISLPSMVIDHAITIGAGQIPTMPTFNITKLLVKEGDLPDMTKGMIADATVTIDNDFPVELRIPPLNFDLLVGNCLPNEPKIDIASASVQNIHVIPKTQVKVNATGFIRELPDDLTNACPTSGRSPLDTLLGGYIGGHEITVFVKGSDQQAPATPNWMSDIISKVTVPVPVPGHTFGDVIRNFTLANVDFSLPDPYASPDSPESNPLISAVIEAFITLPQEINFEVDVQRVRADADVFYKGKKLGELDLNKWRPATSKPAGVDESGRPLLRIESEMKKVPLKITDDDLFTRVIESLLFGGKDVLLEVKALVDVEIDTTLGVLTVREIPAKGQVPVKPISGGFSSFQPKIGKMAILKTEERRLWLSSEASFYNPTDYSATVPYADLHLFVNDTRIGNITVQNIRVVQGQNDNVAFEAMWSPFVDGWEGRKVARDFLSQFVSGHNVTMIARTHAESIPALPGLGKALRSINITMPVPRLEFPADPNKPDDPDDEDDSKHLGFIRGATMHLLTSTAEFSLHSPLVDTTIYITSINATAFYQNDTVGTIVQEMPIAVPPGTSTTPRLPVDWSLGSVGYDAVRKALGGLLKLEASAIVSFTIEEYEETIWYEGKGIGAKIRI